MTDTDYSKYPLGDGTGAYNAPATAPASGVISGIGYTGPWYIEHQYLSIEYLRVPGGGLQTSTTTISLTGATTTHGPITKTVVAALVTAGYQTYLDYASYSTPSYQESQQFQINAASADPHGVSYGTLTASSIGPMGSIITSRPYYRRVPYTGTNQPIINKHIDGATFPMQGVFNNTVSGGVNVHNYWTDYAMWKDGGCVPGTHRQGWSPVMLHFVTDYGIMGEYNVSKETWYDITSYITSVGSRISAVQLFENPTNTAIQPFFNISVPLADLGIAEYNSSHHEY